MRSNMFVRMYCLIFTIIWNSPQVWAENSTTALITTTQTVINATESETNITTEPAVINSTTTILGVVNATDNETTTMPVGSNFSTIPAEIDYNTTNVTEPVIVNQTVTAVAVTDASNATSTTTTLTSSTQTTSPTTILQTKDPVLETTSSSFEETTVTLAPNTIVEKVMNKWNASLSLIDFFNTSFNASAIEQTSPSEVIEIILAIFKGKNQTELQSSIDESISKVAGSILQSRPTVLNKNITDQFLPNQTLNLHGLYVNLHWFHKEVLSKEGILQSFVRNFSLPTSGNILFQDNNTSLVETSLEEFLIFVFKQPTTEQLFEIICGVASEENLDAALCSTPAPSTTVTVTSTASPIAGTQDFQDTWNQVEKNFSFLSDLQNEQLSNVTSSDMTDALVSYVNNLTDNEIEDLVASNLTLYAGNVLQAGENSATEILGDVVIQALGNDKNKTDIFFVYLTFISAFLNDESKFENFLRSYIDSNSARRRKRAADSCDTTSINAEGIICYVIATEGANVTAFLEAVCEQLDSGNATECLNTIPESEPINQAEPTGLSTVEIVGIVLGCVFGFLLILIVAFLIWKYCCSNKRGKVSPRSSPVDYSDDELSNRNHHQEQNRDRTNSGPSAQEQQPSRDNNGGPR